jgi:hypothetical protein
VLHVLNFAGSRAARSISLKSRYLCFAPQTSPTAQPASAVWSLEDWRVYYLDRAAIGEYDGLWPRAEADRRAWRETANRWWREHGFRSAPGICCGCGKLVSLADAVPLPQQ